MGLFSRDDDVCDRLLNDIREKYENYRVLSGCNSDLYLSFEDRYAEMKKAKVKLESFLTEEKELIYGIYDNYVAKQKDVELQKKRLEEFKKRDLMGEIAEKQYAKIDKYPSKVYFNSMDYDLEKLFGAFNYIYLNVYPSIDNIFRFKYSNFGDVLSNIEIALYKFVCRGSAEQLPDVLTRYKILSVSSDNSGIEKEKQEILKKASRFLNGLINFINSQVKDNLSLNDKEKNTLLRHSAYMKDIIKDFRLLPTANPLIF